MRRSWMIVFIAMLISPCISSACTSDGREGFAPENKMYIPKGFGRGGISENEFHKMIDRVSEVYAPIIEGMGAKLNVIRDWDDGTVNAYAQRSGNIWSVRMFGGLARHSAVTADGFALVMCHEVGHHVGGAPRYDLNTDWASNEGQADYFGTLKCFRKVFEDDDNKKAVKRKKISDAVKDSCAKSWNNGGKRNTKEYYLCLRSSLAGESLANLLAKLGNENKPDFSKPDPRVVVRTYDNHPKAQCRLDTYFNGSLCGVFHGDDLDPNDEVVGSCHQTTHDVGTRPLCWFKPKS